MDTKHPKIVEGCVLGEQKCPIWKGGALDGQKQHEQKEGTLKKKSTQMKIKYKFYFLDYSHFFSFKINKQECGLL